jgi:hypothetical protein
MPKFRVFKWASPCWKCKKLTGRIISIEEGKVIVEEPSDKLGRKLSQRYPLFYSKLQPPKEKKKVWCNFCVHCDARQGNYYLHLEWYNDRIKLFSNSIQKVLDAGLCSEEESIEISQDSDESVNEIEIYEERPIRPKSSKDDVPMCPKCGRLGYGSFSGGRLVCEAKNCSYIGPANYYPAPAPLPKKSSVMGRDKRKDTRNRHSAWDEPGPRL